MQPLTTIRTGDARELLALIPFQLGFHPHESAVVVSLRGQRGRVGLVARVDLADLAAASAGAQVARSLVSHLVADGAHRVALVLYTATDLRREPGRSMATRARDHLAQAAEHFLGTTACWVVGPEGYYGLDCTDPTCCPPGGRPSTDLQCTEVGAQMVLSGSVVAGSRDDLVRVVPADAHARRSARRSAARYTARGPATGDREAAHRWRREGLGLWRAELAQAVAQGAGAEGSSDLAPGESGAPAWERPAPAVVGRLQAALADVLVRDAVLLSFVPGADRVADRVVAGCSSTTDGGAQVGAALGLIVDAEDGVPPAAGMLVGASALLHHVLAHSARRVQAPVSTLLAVLAWWEGDGARAGLLVDRALEAEPGYRLAVLMEETLAAGMPPGWLRRPTS